MSLMKHLPLSLVVSGTLLFSSCSLQSVINKSADQQLTVAPSPLELHGDSVRFTLDVQLPPKMMKKKVTYALVPTYQYSGTRYALEDSMVFDGDEINRKQAATQQATFSFPFNEGMKDGELTVVGLAQHKRSGKQLSTPETSIANGVITTPHLVRIGQVSADEEITSIGYYMDHGYNDQEELEP